MRNQSTSPWLTAFINPLNLIMGLCIFFAVLLSAWWMFVIGIIFWLIMMVNIVNDPSMKLNAKLQNRMTFPKRFQEKFEQMEKLQIKLFNSLSNAPQKYHPVLQPIGKEFNHLIEEAYLLCTQFTPLENFLATSPKTETLEEEIKQIEQNINLTTDSETIKEYQEAILSIRSRIEYIKNSKNLMDRVDAAFTGIINELNTIVIDILQIQGLPPSESLLKKEAILNRINIELSEINNYKNHINP